MVDYCPSPCAFEFAATIAPEEGFACNDEGIANCKMFLKYIGDQTYQIWREANTCGGAHAADPMPEIYRNFHKKVVKHEVDAAQWARRYPLATSKAKATAAWLQSEGNVVHRLSGGDASVHWIPGADNEVVMLQLYMKHDKKDVQPPLCVEIKISDSEDTDASIIINEGRQPDGLKLLGHLPTRGYVMSSKPRIEVSRFQRDLLDGVVQLLQEL